MGRKILAVFLTIAAVTATAATRRIEIGRRLALPWDSAGDVRWTGERSIAISAGRRGVWQFEIAKDGLFSASQLIRGEHVPGGFFFSTMLAWGGGAVITASPFSMVGWQRVPGGDAGLTGSFPIATMIDIDASGDQVIILGADRDAKGRWSPDGAIGWLGTLENKLLDLRPVLYSHVTPPTGLPKAIDVSDCSVFDNGAVRFLGNRSFVIVPGVEPGVYLYDRDGRLVYTWSTTKLGVLDHCDMPREKISLYQRDISAREEFLRRQPMVDDVVAIGNDPGLVVRWYEKGHTHWKIVVLHRSGANTELPVPLISDSAVAHLRVDIRGDRVVFLVKHSVDVHVRDKPSPYVVIGRLID